MRNIQIIGVSTHIPVVLASKLRRYANSMIVLTCNPEVDYPFSVGEPLNNKNLSYQKFTRPFGYKR